LAKIIRQITLGSHDIAGDLGLAAKNSCQWPMPKFVGHVYHTLAKSS